MRTICVVTGSRAEYGLLYPLIKLIADDAELQLQLVATGMHLSPEFGLTYRQIEADGFVIDAKVEMLLSSDTPVGITKSMGLGLIGFADAFERLKPDLIVLLGDRFEAMVAAQAAMVANIPIAHLHGGESTEGVIDEAIRHSITKMSHLHFTSTEPYRQRVIQLGELPEHVYNVGAIGLDNIRNLMLLDRPAFEQSINFKLGRLNFLVTYHPLSLSGQDAEQQMERLLAALDYFEQANIIFTKPNADTNGRIIGQLIDKYTAARNERVVCHTSLGQLRYLSAISHVDVVIGNSSSGIIEVPYMHKPTVNIGRRQDGRVKGLSIVDCDDSTDEIIKAINKVLSPDFRRLCNQADSSMYGDGQTAERIIEVLRSVPLDRLLIKSFYTMT
ncbi:UDP-N-acetylglucosamine 2-epimerase (hydrolyzing) [Paenibacillus sp. PR3]|uniref:UDP-N-acetylglucosamine 2-epimerase (Hydrolyzing) n=1 Tax=Paenibacillus terricola TaxID=2763503 RepID=A0ABR8MXM6_9BACL|nr:UDP-N-acetylglucosamine 2-epimerase [Paenibacillus terricola]MBD3920697.1 UDP-N-acetylglucosamine 2-epimerase (hydrolyzing) [Paenibacillus terricola]